MNNAYAAAAIFGFISMGGAALWDGYSCPVAALIAWGGSTLAAIVVAILYCDNLDFG